MILLLLLLLPLTSDAATLTERLDACNQAISSGEYEKALADASVIAKLARSAGDEAALAKSYIVLSDAHYYLGHPDQYKAYVEKALAAFLRINDPAGIGRSYYNLSYCYERTDPLKMLGLLQQALPYSKQSKDDKLRMNIENATGTTLWHLSRFTESITHLEESGRIADQLKEAAYKGTVLQNLGLDYEYLADYDRALNMYREAVAIGEATRRIPLQATALGNLGNVLITLGDPEQALVCFRKSRELHQKTGHRRGEMIQAVNIASIHRQFGESELYSRTLQDALKIAEDIDDLRGQVEIMTSMSEESERRGDFAGADRLLSAALQGATRNGDPGLLLEIRYRQAVLEESRGKLDAALPLAEGAGRQAFSEGDFFRYALCLALQAKIHAKRGDNTTAAALYRNAAEMHESIRCLEFLPAWYAALAALEPQNAEQNYRKSLNAIRKLESLLTIDRFRIQLFDDVSSIYHAYAGWLAQQHRVAEAWSILEDGRNQGLKLRLTQARSTPLTAAEREFLGRINSLQRQLRDGRADRAQRDSLLRQIAAAETDYEDARTEAALQTTQGKSAAPTPSFTGGLVVQYAFLDHELLIFASENGAVHFRKIANADAVIESARALHQVLSTRNSAPPDLLLSKLGEILIAPEIRASTATNVLIIPDRALYFVPFSALKVNGHYLVENRTIRIAPSLVAAHQGGNGAPTGHLLIIAQSNFEAMRSSPFPLPDLPGAIREARELGRYGNDSNVMVNESEGRIKNVDFRQYDVVHFATHTLIDENRPERSSIVTGPDRENDGFLQAREIYRMSIPVQTVILSSCSSGGGKTSDGEGILGLSHALLSAGAQSLVLSLWDVSDQDTAAFMREFYDQLADYPLAEAMRRTQQRMITSRKWNHPGIWAAFAVEGDGSVHPRLRKPASVIHWALALLAVALVFIWGIHRLRILRARPS